jgi:tetratricopeptide (TPR) repeat protein
MILRLPHVRLAALGLLVLGLASAFGSASCGRSSPATNGDTHEADAGPPVDVDVMAFLSEARALHHDANVREQTDDAKGAIAALDRLVHARRPHEGTLVPEVEEVLADTHARIAELRLRTGDLDGASKDIKDGLAHAPQPTYFRGHLLEVDGIVEEARAAALADAGKRDDAQKARARALELLHEAVEVQEQVIQRSLEGRDGK